MDANEFSFKALFNCCDFHFDESERFKDDFAKLNDILETEMCKSDLRNRLDNAAHSCIYEARANAFEQGFRYAVQTMKFLLKL